MAVAPDSWKARHVALDSRVSLTVPVRRGGVMALVMPIPPATISFHGHAIVHPAGSPGVGPLLDELGSLLPAERRNSAAIIEIVPEGAFVTYGIGISLAKMRDPNGMKAITRSMTNVFIQGDAKKALREYGPGAEAFVAMPPSK